MSELTDAEMTLIESTYNGKTKDDWSINRWTKKGDRLYLSGPAKFDKHGIYADLETQTVEGAPSSSWKTDVSIDGDELTISIEKGKVTTKTYIFVVELEGDDQEIVTDGGTVETHECDECGDKFDSEHGLAIHQGMVHNDENTDDTEEPTMTESNTGDTNAKAMADGGEEQSNQDIWVESDGPQLSDDEWETIQTDLRKHLSEIRETYERSSKHEIVTETDAHLVLSDGAGHELYELAEQNDVAHEALRARMHSEARRLTDYDWGDSDPIVVELLEVATDGGEEIREYRGDIEFSDDEVRQYSADGTLYAYREEDEHVVVSRGREPATKWTDWVPATVERPVPGQKRWTIPDNWEKRVRSKRDSIAYGLFYVPESDTWARLSIPTNNWLIDAWYQVEAVGDLAVEPVGDLGSSHDVFQFADAYEQQYDAESVEEDAEAMREIARHWDVVEEDLRRTTEWVRNEGLDEMRTGDQPIPTDGDWQIEFHKASPFRPGEAIERAVDLSDDIQLSIILDELADLLPERYRFELTLNDSCIDMEYYIRGLIEAGASPAEAVDYYMVEVKGRTQTAWGEERGVDQSTASGNVSQAESKLDE